MIIRWIQPPAQGLNTGNFIYNQRMVEELATSGWDAQIVESDRVGEFPAGTLCVLDNQLVLESAAILPGLVARYPCIYMMHLPLVDHGWNKGIDNSPPGELELTIATQCKALITSGRFVAEWASRMIKIKVWMLEPGMDDTGRIVQYAQRPTQFLSVGSWDKRKGQMQLLKALKELETPWNWTIIGAVNDEHYQREVLAKAKSMGLADRITVQPESSREQVIESMLRHDVFIAASQFETYGMALAEAFSVGLPMWTTQVGWLMDRESPLGVVFSHKKSLAHAVDGWSDWSTGAEVRIPHHTTWELQAQTFKGLLLNMQLKAKM